MRFRAPPRDQLAATTFGHPIFDDWSDCRALLEAAGWPTIAAIDAMLAGRTHAVTGRRLRLVEQTPALLSGTQHYESRIFETGDIATRAENWHDLLNALVWRRHTAIKSAINARQAADVVAVGARSRTRAQCALTHYDEAGIVLVLREERRWRAWDDLFWSGLFDGMRSDDYAVAIIGHALLEHALLPGQTLVGKALLALHPDPGAGMRNVLQEVASGIADALLLCDPQELRPLPLVGLPGWHPQSGSEDFLRSAPCFQPKRAGRRYPSPLGISAGALNAAA